MSYFQLDFYTDDVGRRRKVSPRDQRTVILLWMDGHSAREIAEAFGISDSLVRTICYHARQGTRVHRPVSKLEMRKTA